MKCTDFLKKLRADRLREFASKAIDDHRKNPGTSYPYWADDILSVIDELDKNVMAIAGR